MHNNPLLINLILQDFQHHQLVGGLEKMGFVCDGLYDLQVLIVKWQ